MILGNLLRRAGLELMHPVMDEDVKSLTGKRHPQHVGRKPLVLMPEHSISTGLTITACRLLDGKTNN
jgi:hypothetical protein